MTQKNLKIDLRTGFTDQGIVFDNMLNCFIVIVSE